MKKNRIFATLLTSVMLTAALAGSPSVASAGVYDNTLVTDQSISGSLRSDYWWTPSANTGVEYVDGEGIAFTSESRRASRMITVNKAYNFGEYGFEECFTAYMRLKVTSVPTNERFGFVFGLSTQMLNPAAGGANTSFMYFTTENDGLQIGLSNYTGAEKTETEVLTAKELTGKLSDIENYFHVRLKVMASGAVSITVSQNGNSVYEYENKNAKCFTEGNLGFAQTEGGTNAVINEINIETYKAENPANTNILTHFEGNVFNLNELYTSNYPYAERQSYVKPENGGMVFKNTKKAFLSTKREYSNFEAEIEIADLAREASYKEDSTFDTSISTGFTVSLAKSYSSSKAEDSIFSVKFQPKDGGAARQSVATEAVFSFGGETVDRVTLPKELHLWNSEVSGGANIMLKISYMDGNLKVFVKFAGGYNYHEIFSGMVDNACEGYLQIISDISDMTEGVCDNFKIATLSVVNKDYDKNIISLINKDNTSLVYDYQYTDTWRKEDLPFGGK